MHATQQDPVDDLEFLRRVVEESRLGHVSRATGLLLVVAGIAYGLQALTLWAPTAGYLPAASLLPFVVTIAANVVFVTALVVTLIRNRKDLVEKTLVGRAISGFFGGAGLALLALAVVFSVLGMRLGAEVWQIFGSVAAALQGAVWFAAAAVKRGLWIRLVAVGWWTATIVLGLLYGHEAYPLAMGFTLFALMALPGLALWRGGPK